MRPIDSFVDFLIVMVDMVMILSVFEHKKRPGVITLSAVLPTLLLV